MRNWGWLGALWAPLAVAQLNPPANVDHFFLSPGGNGYVLRNDDNPAIQSITISGDAAGDYYPNVKLLIDTLAIDRLGDFDEGNPRGYHQGYTDIVGTPFGFLEPEFGGPERNIWFWDCKNLPGDNCDNGAARTSGIHMPAPLYRGASNSCTRGILGHELAHMIQIAYSQAGTPSGLGKWVSEGQARALQDKIYLDLDTDPEASCVATYLGQVKSYLYGNPDKDVDPDYNKALWELSYDAALWWTYLMEQHGVVTTEPLRGIDFLVTWWDKALDIDDDADSMAITDAAIKEYDPGASVLSEYRAFVLANLFKDMDLSNKSAAFLDRYTYRDEDQAVADNQQYAQVRFTDSDTVGAVSDGVATFISNHYGVQYFSFDLGSCPENRIVKVSFDPISEFFGFPISKWGAWGVIVGQGGADLESQRPVLYYKKVDEEWTVQFQQPANRYENVYVTTTGVQGPVLGELRVACDPPETLGPDLPLVNPLDPMTPGPPDVFTYGPVGPIVLPPVDRFSPPLRNLDPIQFEVAINGLPARVLGGQRQGEGYELFVEHPPQTTPGPHDMRVTVAGLQTETAGAVFYREPRDYNWAYLLMDQSLSMGNPSTDPKLAAAVDAAKVLLEQYDGGVDFRAGLIGYALDAQLLVPLGAYDAAGQSAIETALDNLVPLGPESAVGSAIELARASFAGLAAEEPAGAPAHKEIIVFSDGPLSFGTGWDAIADGVKAAGIRVHAVALGHRADQPLLARIAAETGGRYVYIDDDEADPGTGLAHPDLINAAMRLGGGQHRQQIGGSRQPFNPDTTLRFRIDVPPQGVALLLPAVQAAREAARADTLIDDIRVIDPDGQEVASSFDGRIIALGGKTVVPGRWSVEVDTNAQAVGSLELQAFLALPNGPWLAPTSFLPEIDDEVIVSFLIGQPFGVNARVFTGLLDGVGPPMLGEATLGINDADNRNNQVAVETIELVNEAFYRTKGGAGRKGPTVPVDTLSFQFKEIKFTPSRGGPTGYTDEFSTGQRGSYNFEHRAGLSQVSDDGRTTYSYELIGRQSVAVAEASGGSPPPDGDADLMPDAYEARHDCLDPGFSDGSDDADGDALFNIEEFDRGTDPCDNDTDRGGEQDGSEVAGGRDPLFSRDDALPPALVALVDHELSHAIEPGIVPPNAIRIELPREPRFAQLTLKRSIPPAPLNPYVTIDAIDTLPGFYLDTGLTPGQEYCYQIEPEDAAGNVGRPSAIFCRVARADSESPFGDIVINDGAPRTSDPMLELSLSVYNKNPAEVSMRFGIDAPPQGNGIPFATTHMLLLPAVSEPTETTVSVGFFPASLGPLPPPDEEFVAVETITLMPAQSTGSIAARFTLFSPDGTPVDDPSVAEFMLMVCAEGQPLTHCKESAAYAAADGSVFCPDLLPGTYDVYPQGSSLNTQPIKATVVAGQTTDLGDLTMTIGELFRSSFEGQDVF